MKKTLEQLIGRKFSVYVGGDFERTTNFIGFIKLLHDYGDFDRYSNKELEFYFKNGLKNKAFQIDFNIYAKLGK